MGAILSDPEMMAKIQSLAQSLGQPDESPRQADAPKKEGPPPSPPGIGAGDLEMVKAFTGFARGAEIDKDQRALLKAGHACRKAGPAGIEPYGIRGSEKTDGGVGPCITAMFQGRTAVFAGRYCRMPPKPRPRRLPAHNVLQSRRKSPRASRASLAICCQRGWMRRI